MDAAYDALARAERTDEITDLLRREVAFTQCYTQLVDHLSSLGLHDEAEMWCRQGIAATLEKWPGIAQELRQRLHERARQKKDRPLVAALCAAEFFDAPSLAAYKDLEKATAPLGLWKTVRAGVLRWLETGIRPDCPPDPPKARGARGRKSAAPAVREQKSQWPLPDTGVDTVKSRKRYSIFPDSHVLIEIALHEKRHDDALAWLARAPRGVFGPGYSYCGGLETSVAQAVQETRPDDALDIWRRIAEEAIGQVKPAAY